MPTDVQPGTILTDKNGKTYFCHNITSLTVLTWPIYIIPKNPEARSFEQDIAYTKYESKSVATRVYKTGRKEPSVSADFGHVNWKNWTPVDETTALARVKTLKVGDTYEANGETYVVISDNGKAQKFPVWFVPVQEDSEDGYWIFYSKSNGVYSNRLGCKNLACCTFETYTDNKYWKVVSQDEALKRVLSLFNCKLCGAVSTMRSGGFRCSVTSCENHGTVRDPKGEKWNIMNR